jgi:hypothetical protein
MQGGKIMFRNIFGAPAELKDPSEPFRYDDRLTLHWHRDSMGWTAPLPELGPDAELYIGPDRSTSPPASDSCELVIRTLSIIFDLDQAARAFLIEQAGAFVEKSFAHKLSAHSFIPTGIELFEHEHAPGELSFTYSAVFDRDSIWRVRFQNGAPTQWGFDD